MRKINKKILWIAVLSLAAVMLTTPLMASAKPTTKSVVFRVETWPDIAGTDLERLKIFATGQEKFLIIQRLACIGTPPLIDNGPDADYPTDFLRGGVRLVITDVGTYTGTAKQLIIKTKAEAGPETGFSMEKWTFDFGDDGTLEVSTTFCDGEGECVSTIGTGDFAGAHFKGTYDVTLTWYDSVGYKVVDGTGEIRFKALPT